ncbi:MAG: DUF4276 family protein [Planctomycetes bacterium]|nr:DUF4276 family protein [Planctomycetota bacterium]
MIDVRVVVEGQTEEMFVNRVLRSHFWPLGIKLRPQLLGHGGVREYGVARIDILTVLRLQTHSFCTTMFDYYAMPSSWPNREAAKEKPFAEKAAAIEWAISADIQRELGQGFDASRFIPYVQMHEFEALLFSHPKLLADGLDLADDTPIQAIRGQFATPEDINDGQHTAPSKRIVGLSAKYSKVTRGILISQNIGLNVMRAQCPHFNEWIGKLEALPGR